jgi:uncharacterized protein
MKEPATLRRREGSLAVFFLLTFVVTWVCFIGAVRIFGKVPAGTPPGIALQALLLLGTFAPGLVAVALTARNEGREGLHGLLGRLFAWQTKARWYVFAVTFMAAIKLTAAVLYRIATGGWAPFGHESWVLMLAATAFSTLIGGQSGEELGWRGFALPRLAARLGLARASLLLGVIWALWHLPLFYLPQADTYGQSFLLYLLQVTALSVAIAWLYERTGGSLLLTMLMHASINNTKDIVPSGGRTPMNPFVTNASPISWLTLALLWITAGTLLILMHRKRGSELARA